MTLPGLVLSGLGAVVAPSFTAAAQASTPTASAWTAPASVNRTPSGGTPSTAWPVGGRTGANLGQQSWYATESFALWEDVAAQVNLATGNFVLNSDDGPGPARVYNSKATGSGAFGTGTVMVGGRDVGLVVSGTNRVFHAPSGFTATFTPKAGGGWTAPSGLNADLKENPDGTRTLTYRKSSQSLTFTAGGYLLREADRNGNAQTYRYWSDGLLASVTDIAGRVTSFGYTSGRVTKVTEPGGRFTTYGYDTAGQLTSVTDPTGATTTYTWTNGKLSLIKDPRGNYSEVRYDSSGRVASFRRYNEPGSADNPASVTWFNYGNPTGTAGATTQTVVVTDVRDNDASFDLDSAGRVVKVTDANGVVRAKTWTANSDVQTAVDAFGTGQTAADVTTTYTYESGTNNLTKVQLPTGATATATYSATADCPATGAGHPYQAKCTTDGQGNSAAYEYDGPGNVLKVKDTSAGGTVENTYTYQGTNGVTCGGKPGQMCTATDGRGHTTRYAYDTDGNLVTVTYPAVTSGTSLGVVTYTYDQVGRVTSVKDGKNQTTSYAYDARDRVTQVTYAGTGGKVIYAFDSDGNLTAQHDIASTGTVSTTTYGYDTLNRQTSKQLPGQAAEVVEYDEAGNVTRYTDPTGFITRYTSDAANQLTHIGNSAGCTVDPLECTTMTYQDGRLRTVTYPGNTVQTYTYDGSGRVTGIKAVNGSATLTDYTYTYTASNGSGDQALIRTRTDKVGNGAPANSTISYGYDSLNRLTSAVEKVGTSSTVNASWAYQYDPAGNRTRSDVVTAPGGSPAINIWGYNQVDQLTSRHGSTSGWAYDANGNETSSPGAVVVAGVQPRTAVLNSRDQVTSITSNGNSTTPFSYLGESNLERTQAGSTTFLNGALGLATAGNYGFTRTPGGTPIAQRLSEDEKLYYLTDIQGSVVAMVNTAGQKVATYSYDPYGQPRATSGSAAANNPIRYTGGYLDTTTGLYKLGYRYYDPSTGRFTQVDPTGQEENGYLYAGGNPVNFIDPDGDFAFAILAVPVAINWGTVAASAAGAAVGGAVGYGIAEMAKGGRQNLRKTGDQGEDTTDEKVSGNRRNSGGDGRGTQKKTPSQNLPKKPKKTYE